MPYSSTISASTIEQWVAEKFDISKIKHELQSLGLDEETISNHIKEFIKAKHSKKLFRGFMVLGLGAFLGFLSCVLALTNPVPFLYYWFLYGITSLALVFIFLGLYLILE